MTSIDTTIVVLLWSQIRALRCAGYDVLCTSSPGPNAQWLNDQGVAHHAVKIHRSITPFADLRALWRLWRLMRRERITIAHMHTPKAALLGVLAARLARVPVIINTVHGFYFHDRMKAAARWFHIAMAWLAGRCAHLTLSQSAEDVQTAKRLRLCRVGAMRHLGNGIDLTRFNPDAACDEVRTRKRAEYRLSDDIIAIGIVGRLVNEKGYLELFEALRKLRAERQDFHLLIVGPHDAHRAGAIAPDSYREFGLDRYVSYLGTCDRVDEFLAAVDIFVLPSWREGMPRSAIEAAAMRLPVIATDVRGCREVVKHDYNGLLVPPREPAALADAIRQLLDDPELRTRLGSAGYARARAEFDEDKICRRVLDAYSEELNRVGRSSPLPAPHLHENLPKRGPFAW